ncbi:hypothetical protein EYF80_008515 [Liparis tanakae]|uniref:Uncharacterized protein n=1 Tax=Liparis tanakae TaxID=230148 RepID=A0A4Z2ITM9_9TELE|nr:hypothetical protein EYF80_008515 [Liparis tanakae]
MNMNKEELDQNMCKDGSSAEKVDAVEVQTPHRRTQKRFICFASGPKVHAPLLARVLVREWEEKGEGGERPLRKAGGDGVVLIGCEHSHGSAGTLNRELCNCWGINAMLAEYLNLREARQQPCLTPLGL